MLGRFEILRPILVLGLLMGMGFFVGFAQAQEGPFIEANISGDWVAAYAFENGSETAKLEVFAPGESEPKCEGIFGLAGGEIKLECWDPMVQPGDTIKLFVDDGPIPVKEHVAFELTLDVFDPEGGDFSGTAQLETIVRVDYCNPPSEEQPEGFCDSDETATLPDGTWEIAFGPNTVSPDTWFGAFISDEDGDTTFAELSAPPIIDFNLIFNWLVISGYPPGEDVLVELFTDESKTERIDDFVLTTDGHGYAGWDTMLDLSPGNMIVAACVECEDIKELVLANLSVDDYDVENDLASGFAEDGTEVFVDLEGGAVEFLEVVTIAGPSGWLIDFWAEHEVDLTEDMFIWAYIVDPDGDMTTAQLPELPLPTIMAYPLWDWVDGVDWSLEKKVTLVVEDDFDPNNGNLYVATGMPVEVPWAHSLVSFNLDNVVDLQAGHILIMFNAEFSKVHIVTSLTVTDIELATSEIGGTAEAFSEVVLMVNWSPETEVVAYVDDEGNWSADFGTPDALGHRDLVVSGQIDEDGDSTWVNWNIVTPSGLVDEIMNLPEEELAPEIRNSLAVKIENAAKSLSKGNATAAIHMLEAFIHQVQALRGNKMSETIADHLYHSAQTLIDLIELGIY